MPLLDHFRPPLSNRRDWESFHTIWTGEIVRWLNGSVLGDRLFAEATVRLGRAHEVDVATLEEVPSDPAPGGTEDGGGTAVAAAPAWVPPAVELEAPTAFPDEFEVRVFSTAAGPVLVGVIELVGPANKDRPDHRRAFAAKVVSYLNRKVGVVVVDVVTERLANLHDEVCDFLALGPAYRFEFAPATYAVSYRPVRRPNGDRIEMWRRTLAVGDGLPVMPLGLRNAGVIPVDLELTYPEACRGSRIG